MLKPRVFVQLVGALLLLAITASCAYYNTFYLARKYYLKATNGAPYEVDREGTTQRQNYSRSGDYCKKVLGIYPRSKWVDDAYLMWAQTFLGVDDPLKAVAMLEEFQGRYPTSDLRPDAEFFLGLAYRAARKHEQSLAAFDEFLVQAPKHELAPYAWYERSKALMSLRRFGEAAESATKVLTDYKRSPLLDRAQRQRAEALFQKGDYAGAQADFHAMGNRALTDEERLRFLLREVDCLEAARQYAQARELLKDTRSHVPPPPPLPVADRVGSTTNAGLPNNQPPPTYVRTPEQERYGKLTVRMGGVEVLDGKVAAAVELYRSVIQDYPRSQLAAEAQYRIGYAYETGADDFEQARTEYSKVKEQVGTSQFVQQADQRLENLGRIERYRTAGGADSLARKAEARFLRAEHYLFNLERPERALDEYRAIVDSVDVKSVQARALNAQAWVLARKLDRKEAADSLFWRVVREFPETEGQLAARDYLEAEGIAVPASLIVPPKSASKPLLEPTEDELADGAEGAGTGARREPSIPEPGAVRFGPGVNSPSQPTLTPSQLRNRMLPDSLRRQMAVRDSLVRIARADTSATGRARVDSLRRAFARPDTAGRGALMAQIQQQVSRANGVVLAPDSVAPPDFSQVDSLPASALARGTPATAKGGAALPSAPRLGAVPRKMTRADSLRARVVADSLRAVAVTDSMRIAAAADSARRVFEAERQRVVADSLEEAAAIQRVRAAADSAYRARVVADSLANAKKKPAKIKPPSDPNVGFSSVWSKSEPDSVKQARKLAKQLAKQQERERKEAEAERKRLEKEKQKKERQEKQEKKTP